MSAKVFLKIIKGFVQNLKNQMLRCQKINLTDYLDQINQNLAFFDEFCEFYENHKGNFKNDFIRNLINQSSISDQIYSINEFCLKRI